jgi:hypothetical protein
MSVMNNVNVLKVCNLCMHISEKCASGYSERLQQLHYGRTRAGASCSLSTVERISTCLQQTMRVDDDILLTVSVLGNTVPGPR